ncbi:MAG: cation:proton antiporter, partial [Acidobacteriota bacterium]
MLTILQLIGILVIGYLGAHFIVGRLQRRFLFSSGVEYIFLGLLAGPQVTGVMTAEVVSQLTPVMSLAIGAIGLLYGLHLRGWNLTRIEGEFYRITLVEVLTTSALVGGAAFLVFWHLMGVTEDWIAVVSAALVLAATAAVSAPNMIENLVRRHEAGGRLSRLLEFVTNFNQVLGITLFGLVFCLLRVGETRGIQVTRTEWAAINIGLGVLLGILFFLFLGREKSEQKLTLALIGIVIFAGGSAYYLNVSPLFVCLILGMVLGLTSDVKDRLLKILHHFEGPLYVVVLIFAGAAWQPSAHFPAALLAGLAGGYVFLRYLGKLFGGYLAHRYSLVPDAIPARAGLGFISQGA